MSVASTSANNSEPQAGELETRGPVLEMLRKLLAERRDEHVVRLVAQLLSRNVELEKRLARRRLGAANVSEGMTSEQLELFLQALQEEANQALQQANKQLEQAVTQPPKPPAPPKPPRQPALRRPVPENLRRVDNPIAVAEDQRGCPVCGKARTCIGHDITEVIELVPAEVIVRRDMRELLACRPCEGELERAPLGDKVISRGIYGSTLVATLLVRKYDHGMPMHRLREELLRLGLDMPSASASDQIQWATDLLRPLSLQAQSDVLHARFLQLDPTSLPVRDKEHGYGITLGSLCAYIGDQQTVVYLYASTGKKNGQRPGEVGPEDFLAEREGLTMADASNAFDKSFARPAMLECGCNMHARRGFVKAIDSGDTRAALPIAAYKRLYDIEEEAAVLDIAARTELRQQKSRPVYDELLSWCRQYRPHEPPKTPLATACGYLINHHIALMRFLDDGSMRWTPFFGPRGRSDKVEPARFSSRLGD